MYDSGNCGKVELDPFDDPRDKRVVERKKPLLVLEKCEDAEIGCILNIEGLLGEFSPSQIYPAALDHSKRAESKFVVGLTRLLRCVANPANCV